MDKLKCLSCVLFMAATGFAIASLVMPDWIVTNIGGDTRLGLFRTCVTLHGHKMVCHPASLPTEWTVALVLIFIGIFCLLSTLAVTLLPPSFTRGLKKSAKWLGFSTVVVFCLAAVIFPMGFTMNEIGGAPFQLPNSYQVGLSYIFFIMSLWITVISELFASKICLPHF